MSNTSTTNTEMESSSCQRIEKNIQAAERAGINMLGAIASAFMIEIQLLENRIIELEKENKNG